MTRNAIKTEQAAGAMQNSFEASFSKHIFHLQTGKVGWTVL